MKMDRITRFTIIAMLGLIFHIGTLAAQPRGSTPIDSLGPLIDDSVRLAPCDSVAIMGEMIESLWRVGWNGGSKSTLKKYRGKIDSVDGEHNRKRAIGDEPTIFLPPEKSCRRWRETRNEKMRLLLWTTSITMDTEEKSNVSSVALVWAQFRDTAGRTRWALGREMSHDSLEECHRWRLNAGPSDGDGLGGDDSEYGLGGFTSVNRLEISIASRSQRNIIVNDSTRKADSEITANRARIAEAARISRSPGIQMYDHPPTNADIYLFLGDTGPHPGDPNSSMLTWGLMNRQLGTRNVEGAIRGVAGTIWRAEWREAVGEYPTREFKYLEREE